MSYITVRIVKSGVHAEHVDGRGKKCIQNLGGKSLRKHSLGRPRKRWEDIKLDCEDWQ
jgi:hypothetical protein